MLLALLLSFLTAGLVGPLVRRASPYGGWLVSVIPASLFIYFLIIGLGFSGPEALLETIDWVPALGISIRLRLDGFSLLFALIITGVGTLVVVYAGAYFADGPPAQTARFLRLIVLFTSAMLGAVLADDLVVLFVFWEATSLLSFLLIGFHSERAEARKAALQSLLVTAGGGLSLFAGILLIGIQLDTFALSEIVERSAMLGGSPIVVPAMVLVMAGAFAKSAQVPFHFWLPAAMEAPTPASAFLHSATMVKLGVYLLARFDRVFDNVPAFGATLVAVGTTTMVVAVVRALFSDGYKAVLAQSTVASLGLLVMLVGLDGASAAAATVAFILAHALYKAALFFCAGTAIHATHEGRLSHLGGLRHSLPMTALASGLAAMAMAGLPPTFNFIGKETALAAQLSTATPVVTVCSVFVTAMFVAIAAVTGIRPFFSGAKVPRVLHQPETSGLVVAPLLLGILGLVFGLVPAAIGNSVIAPAVSALRGGPETVSLSLWHGFSAPLLLSIVIVASGLAISSRWRSLQIRLKPMAQVDRLLGDAGYERLYDGILATAERSTRLLQNGDQHRYSAVVLGAVIATVALGLLAAGIPMPHATGHSAFDPRSAVVLLLMSAGALAATRTQSLLIALISTGVVGFGSALVYVMNGAPDLALTQFSVEVLVVVILTALLLRIPPSGATRSLAERRGDTLLSLGVAAMIFLALWSMAAAPLDTRLTDYFAATSYLEAHGRNVVNVIIVDYRGIDTLGEISVVAFATITVWGLLRRRRGARKP